MIDKELFKLIGKNKKYIFIAVLLQVIGLIANVGITASICWAIYLAFTRSEPVMYSYRNLCIDRNYRPLYNDKVDGRYERRSRA